jgi:S-adenosylmethionine:tRNA ribosyltransferase-isomerase
MIPARTFPARRDGVRLLLVDPSAGRLRSLRMPDLPTLLGRGDLLVLNDAATVPASLKGEDDEGNRVEARLLSAGDDGAFSAVLFGPGDWRQRTEDRPPPPVLTPGARLRFGALEARVSAPSTRSPRLVQLRFAVSGAALWAALYREARPIQYSYLAHELPLWAVQTAYASRPWAFEMPSAGRPLSWEILLALRRRGVGLAALTHAAGFSASGDAALDAALPLAERFEIPPATVAAVRAARRRGGRVVAVGTTVVRALEGAVAHWGELRAGAGETELRLDPSYRPRVVDGVLSGVHGPGESHFALLGAFAPVALLEAAADRASAEGYLAHELGDAMLVLPGSIRRELPGNVRNGHSGEDAERRRGYPIVGALCASVRFRRPGP